MASSTSNNSTTCVIPCQAGEQQHRSLKASRPGPLPSAPWNPPVETCGGFALVSTSHEAWRFDRIHGWRHRSQRSIRTAACGELSGSTASMPSTRANEQEELRGILKWVSKPTTQDDYGRGKLWTFALRTLGVEPKLALQSLTRVCIT